MLSSSALALSSSIEDPLERTAVQEVLRDLGGWKRWRQAIMAKGELQARTKQTARKTTGGSECPPDVLARTSHDNQRAFLDAAHRHSFSCDQRQKWFQKEETLHPERFHDDGKYHHPSDQNKQKFDGSISSLPFRCP